MFTESSYKHARIIDINNPKAIPPAGITNSKQSPQAKNEKYYRTSHNLTLIVLFPHLQPTSYEFAPP